MALLNDSHRELIDAVREERLIIFAGAGISKSSGFPLWGELILKIIERIQNDNPPKAKTLLSYWDDPIDPEKKILDILHFIEYHNLITYAYDILNKEIFERGKKLIDEKQPLLLHSRLWEVSTKIITPNYDILFESCKKFKKLNHPPVTNESFQQLSGIQNEKKYLFKIHGSINDLNSIIFFPSQYEKQYRESAAKDALASLVKEHPILFIGTSMSDPYINKIIEQVSFTFHNSSPGKFFLTNEDISTAAITRIEGDSIYNLEDLLNELLEKKKEYSGILAPEMQPLRRMRPVSDAIEELHKDSMELFPSLEDFANDTIPLNIDIFKYIKNRFDHQEGPVLCQGRWSTGKTVSTLKIGMELSKHGYTVYYLDAANEIHGKERNLYENYYHKTLGRYRSEKTAFIVDNIHYFPDHFYTICNAAKKEKINCIFVGRPPTKQFSGRDNYYPSLFDYRKNKDKSHVKEENTDVFAGIITSPKIIFKPTTGYIKSIFESKLKALGRKDQILEAEVEKFSKSVSYNLSLVTFHVNAIDVDTKNIYQLNYDKLNPLIRHEHSMSDFQEEIHIIAALSFLDCKIDATAIFSSNQERENNFLDILKYKIYSNRDERYIYGMSAAMGQLILDIGFRKSLIRKNDNNLCCSFHEVLESLLEKYLLKKPKNIYSVFLGLSNYEHECYEADDFKSLEEVKEIVYGLLIDKEIHTHYTNTIIHKTDSLLKLGFFINTFKRHHIERSVFISVINEETIIKLVDNFTKYYTNRHQNFRITWHFYYVWSALIKLDKELARFFISQFSKEVIIQYASRSISALTNILHIARFHSYMDDLIFTNRNGIIGTREHFLEKFKGSKITKIIFLMAALKKLEEGENFKNRDLLHTIKSYITPEDYKNYILSLPPSKITVESFNIPHRYLGKEYAAVLESNFPEEFIYRLFFEKPLVEIKRLVTTVRWKHFIEKDIISKIKEASVSDISTFISNVSLNGSAEDCIRKLISTFYEERTTQIILHKLRKELIDETFNFFWQLKTLDEDLFNIYFDKYCSADPEFGPLKVKRTQEAFLFLLLIYCYSENIIAKTLIDRDHVEAHNNGTVISGFFSDKVYLSAFSFVFHEEINIRYNRSKEERRGIHFVENLFDDLHDVRTRSVDKNKLPYWKESKLLTFAFYLIGVNNMDKNILKNPRFKYAIPLYLRDTKNLLKDLENRKTLLSHKSYNKLSSITNRVNLLKSALDIFEKP